MNDQILYEIGLSFCKNYLLLCWTTLSADINCKAY